MDCSETAAAQSMWRAWQKDEEVECSMLPRRQTKSSVSQKGWAVERDTAAGLKQTTGLSMGRGCWVLLEGSSN